MRTPRVIVIGAGVGGLAASIDLARQGLAVTVLEKEAYVGGKIRVDWAGIDSGPTVLTMRWVFEALFADAAVREEFSARLPMRRHGEVEEIASAIAFLASEASSFTTGAVHVIDGGWTA